MDLFNELTEASNQPLCEAEPPYAHIRELSRVPEVMPCAFDVTIDFWLDRINLWGKLHITRTDPYTKKKEKLTKSKLLDIVTDPTLLNVAGKWNFKKLSLTSVEMYREYVDLAGKKVKESVIIEVELDPVIQGVIDYWKKRK